MKRWAAIFVAVGLLVGSVVVAPAATAGVAPSPSRLQPVLAMSDSTTCAVRETYRVYCWGGNVSGELGRSSFSVTQTVAPVNIVLNDAIAVYGSTTSETWGGSFCALKIDRTVACWGENGDYQVNGASTANVSTPTVVSGISAVASVAMGTYATCFVKQNGSVYCMGTSSAILGTSPVTAPTKVAGLSNVVSIAVGLHFACALKVDHTVWCWGSNPSGQLGDGTYDSKFVPVKVSGLTDASEVVAGGNHACALRSGGTVVCWGQQGSGQGGHVPISAAQKTNVPLSVTDVKGVTGIASTTNTNCATTATLVKCWGYGGVFQLGDSQQNSAFGAATAVVGLAKPTAIALSAVDTCEIADGGKVWCWGLNSSGGAGTGNLATARDGGGPGNAFGVPLTPRAIPILNGAPGKPSGSSKSAKKISITWAAPSTSNGTSAPTDYVIKYKLKGSTTWKTFKDSVSATRSATITGLTTGKYYQFRVYPKNWAGTGSASTASGYIKSK